MRSQRTNSSLPVRGRQWPQLRLFYSSETYSSYTSVPPSANLQYTVKMATSAVSFRSETRPLRRCPAVAEANLETCAWSCWSQRRRRRPSAPALPDSSAQLSLPSPLATAPLLAVKIGQCHHSLIGAHTLDFVRTFCEKRERRDDPATWTDASRGFDKARQAFRDDFPPECCKEGNIDVALR